MVTAGENTLERRDLANQVLQFHKLQLDLCNRLEDFADSLPDSFDKQECLSISWQIIPTVMKAHHFEEEILFPTLLSRAAVSQSLPRSIERLRFEHWEDEASAEDLSLYLRDLVQSPDQANVEKIAYVLRGFFEGLRRHIAFEVEHLLPQLETT